MRFVLLENCAWQQREKGKYVGVYIEEYAVEYVGKYVWNSADIDTDSSLGAVVLASNFFCFF